MNARTPYPNRISADPNKAFFIDMLTLDIPLAGCILDLIDNSAHRLILDTGLDVMQILKGRKPAEPKVRAEIKVDFSPSKFVISDTCGGISIDDARTAVFKLGNPNPDKGQAGLGVYGIGMKRAIFKLGRLIKVTSNTQQEEFGVTIDVDKWKKRESWDLKFDYARAKRERKKTLGTRIEVTRLHEGVKRAFGLQSFKTDVARRVSTTFPLFLKSGVLLNVNGREVAPSLPEFAQSPSIEIGQRSFTAAGVQVLVMAGLSPVPDRTARGWYVFCNGRTVLEADKTYATGWGDKFPGFHVKYNHFLGYVYFKSKDPARLPWTTTKEDVVREASVYQRALAEMKIQARPVLEFLSRKYPADIQPEGVPERETHGSARAVSVETVASSKKKSSVFTAKTSKQKDSQLVNILYKRPRKDVERIKRAIGKPRMSAAKVGEYTFDMFVRRECD